MCIYEHEGISIHVHTFSVLEVGVVVILIACHISSIASYGEANETVYRILTRAQTYYTTSSDSGHTYSSYNTCVHTCTCIYPLIIVLFICMRTPLLRRIATGSKCLQVIPLGIIHRVLTAYIHVTLIFITFIFVGLMMFLYSLACCPRRNTVCIANIAVFLYNYL